MTRETHHDGFKWFIGSDVCLQFFQTDSLKEVIIFGWHVKSLLDEDRTLLKNWNMFREETIARLPKAMIYHGYIFEFHSKLSKTMQYQQ
jgi:hypothetical protein